VTGASSGIGRSIAERFAREGADVAVHYRSEADAAAEVVAGIRALARRAVALEADASDVAAVRRMVEAAVAGLGRIDVLVNSAGLEIHEDFLAVTEEHWDLVLDVNLKGAYFAMQAVARHLVERGAPGRLINISSIHEDVAFLGFSPYAASKGGLRMATRTIAQVLAPHGITVNDIAPGAIATPINRRTLADSERLKELETMIPVGRLGTPDEVASVAVFLASDEAGYVTGSTYYVDGGMSNWNRGL
jgi:glucose 1-dehydrogenase